MPVSVSVPVPSAARDSTDGVSLFSTDAAVSASQDVLQKQLQDETAAAAAAAAAAEAAAAAATAAAAAETEAVASRIAAAAQAADMLAAAAASERADLLQLMNDVIDAVE